MKLTARLLALGSLLLLAACSSGLEPELPTLETLETTTTLRIPISAASDDAEEITGGSMQLTGGLLDLRAKDGILQTSAMRFQKMAIPQGAKITSAYLEVRSGSAESGTVNLQVRGEASDNAATFTTTKGNISSRAKTAAALNWNPESWLQGKPYQTGNLTSVVQEVVSRSGWKSGNALALFIAGVGGSAERSAVAYGGQVNHIPVLVVTFSAGETVADPEPTPEPEPAPEPTPTPPATGGTLTAKAVSGADDAEEMAGGVLRTDTPRALSFSAEQGVAQSVGLRFGSITIPQGAKITAATITFKASTADSGALGLQVRGEAADNAAPFGSDGFMSRAKTAAFATWTPNAWTQGQTTRTADLTGIVQEVVSRGGWKSGNALAFYVTGDGKVKRSAYAREAGEATAPLLSISFEAPQQPAPEPEPTPDPEPEPTPDPEPVDPGVPSGDLATWHDRLIATIENPQYNSVLDPENMAATGDLYRYGRDFNHYVTSLTLAYRETGDRDLVRQLDSLMNIAKSKLRDTNGDGYVNWRYLNSGADSTSQPFYGTDLHVMDEMLTHSMVAAAAYTLKQAGFSSAGFWTDYLKNDFEAKWRGRNKKASGFPFIRHFLMHPSAQFIRYNFYMAKLTGDSSYYSEAKRMAGVVKAHMNTTSTPSGVGYTWLHDINESTGQGKAKCQPTVYIRLTTQAFADLAVMDSSLFDATFMKRVANAMAYKVLTKSDGTEMAGNICGSGTFGTVYTFAQMPYAQLAPWDASNRLETAAERVYAATERRTLESPKSANIAAQMVFTLGR